MNQSGRKSESCHMCKSNSVKLVLDLGSHPPSNAFLKPELLEKDEESYPLRLVSCSDCGLLQIDYFVDPRILFRKDYPYESSTTETLRNYYHQMAREVCEKFSVPRESLAIDIGSNVGVLLGGFKKEGMRVLGVDPAENIARKATVNGIETVAKFFNADVAKDIVSKYGKAAVVTGTNVFAHIRDLDSATKGMKIILKDEGVIVIESPHVLELIRHLEYDTIYHEHIGYLSVRPVRKYLSSLGLELFDLKKSTIHGGSLRFYVGHAGKHPIKPIVKEMEKEEEQYGIYSEERLAKFAKEVENQKKTLVNLLVDLKNKGHKIAGISAPAKGNTLLNYCSIDTSLVDFLTEKADLKIGLYSPGTRIPIYPDGKLMEENVDYALLLAWNFADEIMKNLSDFKNKGGKFIIPIPKPKLV